MSLIVSQLQLDSSCMIFFIFNGNKNKPKVKLVYGMVLSIYTFIPDIQHLSIITEYYTHLFQKLDYILDVMLPEILIRIYMHIKKVEYVVAEKQMNEDY